MAWIDSIKGSQPGTEPWHPPGSSQDPFALAPHRGSVSGPPGRGGSHDVADSANGTGYPGSSPGNAPGRGSVHGQDRHSPGPARQGQVLIESAELAIRAFKQDPDLYNNRDYLLYLQAEIQAFLAAEPIIARPYESMARGTRSDLHALWQTIGDLANPPLKDVPPALPALPLTLRTIKDDGQVVLRTPAYASVALDNGLESLTTIQAMDVYADGDLRQDYYASGLMTVERDADGGIVAFHNNEPYLQKLEGAQSLGQAMDKATLALTRGDMAAEPLALPIFDPVAIRRDAHVGNLAAAAIGLGDDGPNRPGAMPRPVSRHPQVLNSSRVVLSGPAEFNFRDFDADHAIRLQLDAMARELDARAALNLDQPQALSGPRLRNLLGAEMGMLPNTAEAVLRDDSAVNYTGMPLAMIDAVAAGIEKVGGDAPVLEILGVYSLVEGHNQQGQHIGTLMRTPLFRVRVAGAPDTHRLVDTRGDSYEDMQHFRQRNTLPATAALITPVMDASRSPGSNPVGPAQTRHAPLDESGRYRFEIGDNRRMGKSDAWNIAKSLVYGGSAVSAVVLVLGSKGLAAPMLLPVAGKLTALGLGVSAVDAGGELARLHGVGAGVGDPRVMTATVNLLSVGASAAGTAVRSTSGLAALAGNLRALESSSDFGSLMLGGQELVREWGLMDDGQRLASTAQLAFWGAMLGLNTSRMIANLDAGSGRTQPQGAPGASAAEPGLPIPGQGNQSGNELGMNDWNQLRNLIFEEYNTVAHLYGTRSLSRAEFLNFIQGNSNADSISINRGRYQALWNAANPGHHNGRAAQVEAFASIEGNRILTDAYSNYLNYSYSWGDTHSLKSAEEFLGILKLRFLQAEPQELSSFLTFVQGEVTSGGLNLGGGARQPSDAPFQFFDSMLNQSYASYVAGASSSPMSPREWLVHIHGLYLQSPEPRYSLYDFSLDVQYDH